MTDEAESTPALTLDGVEFGYVANTTVLHGIDLAVEAGEFITVIGQNGSGKSTLVKQFNGLLKPDAGEVTVHDAEGTAYRTADHPMNVLARTVGYVFQNPDDQLFHTKVGEEIEYGLRNIGVPEAERKARMAQVLEDVGLPVAADANPFNFSKGQRQRLAIAAVLAMEPHVICVDEPTTGQDHTEARRIMDILREYNNRGHTVITITHDIALAAAYTDRVIVVKDGQIIADGPPEQVFLDEANLKETNVRPPQITQLGIRLAETAPPGVLEEMWLTTDDAYLDISGSLNRPAESDPSVSVEESDD